MGRVRGGLVLLVAPPPLPSSASTTFSRSPAHVLTLSLAPCSHQGGCQGRRQEVDSSPRASPSSPPSSLSFTLDPSRKVCCNPPASPKSLLPSLLESVRARARAIASASSFEPTIRPFLPPLVLASLRLALSSLLALCALGTSSPVLARRIAARTSAVGEQERPCRALSSLRARTPLPDGRLSLSSALGAARPGEHLFLQLCSTRCRSRDPACLSIRRQEQEGRGGGGAGGRRPRSTGPGSPLTSSASRSRSSFSTHL